MKQYKKIEKLVLHYDGMNVAFCDTGETTSLFINEKPITYFEGKEDKFLKQLLTEQLVAERKVPRGSFYSITKAKDRDKQISNVFSRINVKLQDCGLYGLLETGDQGDKLQYCLNRDARVVSAEYSEQLTDPFSGVFSPGTAVYPAASSFVNDEEISSSFLPLCSSTFGRYTSLYDCISREFLKSGTCSSLIVSAVGGGGKTFSLCHAYGEAVNSSYAAFYVRCGSLEEEEHSLLHYIARNYLKASSYHDHVDIMDQFMRESRGPVLILVDGMNEASVKKQDFCTRSFSQMQQKYPDRIRGVFSTRFPQALKSRLPRSMTVELKGLLLNKFSEESQQLLARLHVEATPLILKLLETMEKEQLGRIQNRYELFRLYFDKLAETADLKSADGWIYTVLGHIAAASMEGAVINTPWLESLCSRKDYDFIHQWSYDGAYPLTDLSTVDKLKGTGFLMRDGLDRYILHQQIRDCLAVRYGLLQLEYGVIDAADFADRLLDATRYYTVSSDEDMAAVNLHRHNNIDLGEFGFYALWDWYVNHRGDRKLLPKLVQLGIQVAYLFDNVQNWYGLYALHCHLDSLLEECFALNLTDERLRRSLPGYYFCLNKLVSTGHDIKELSGKNRLSFSEKVESYYKNWLQSVHASDDPELEALARSGLGGVYLTRSHVSTSYSKRIYWLNQSMGQHQLAKDLRESTGSPKLYLSLGALGTVNYHTAKAYRGNPESGNLAEAEKLLQDAIGFHQRAAGMEACRDKYVYHTRIAGCCYELYQLAEDRMDNEAAQQAQHCLLDAFHDSSSALEDAVKRDGAVRHGSEIHTLLHDINRYMRMLPLYDTDTRFIERICEMYHQAFPYEPEPRMNVEKTGIKFR